MRVYVYLRVSTDKQDIESQYQSIKKKLQELNIKKEDIEVIKDEGISGGVPALQRQGFQYLFSKIQSGDVLIVSELSRLGRNLSDVIFVLDKLIREKKVRVISCKENLDSHRDAFQFKVMTTLISLFADLEREFIRKRTREGLMRAKEQGKHIGRPRKLNYKLIFKLWEEGKSISEIVDLTGYSYSAVAVAIHRAKKRGILIEKPQRRVKWAILEKGGDGNE
ncbi:recombinase family protein [Thermococcus eurythermalis]|uniref:recombinase family protein n=1 Tax=Thermococcus eurythermalis TaxID=1505907 RepID=UPI00067857E5|nr:recombinase family protein [Thermococcus eurythermalis]